MTSQYRELFCVQGASIGRGGGGGGVYNTNTIRMFTYAQHNYITKTEHSVLMTTYITFIEGFVKYEYIKE